MTTIPTSNGYIKSFFVLGNESGKAFINHHSSKVLISDPMKSRMFDSYKDALDFNVQFKNNYSEKLFVYQIRVTVELV
ncbi:MAG TPA: hypothetical protein DC057_15480 [Spirochaetia bacterium]|nr:hypothetical protein [Spirochaetia bacterium]